MAAWHCRQHCALSLLALALLPLSAGQGVAPLLKAIDGNNPSQINMALKSTHPKLLKEVDATGTMPRQKRSPSAPGLAPSRCTQARLRWWCLEASSAAVSCWRRGVPRLASAFGAPACQPERLGSQSWHLGCRLKSSRAAFGTGAVGSAPACSSL